ncbi:diphosphomevalonate decarboxylase [Marinobacterium sp. D7]|uniref:diphosphomevalonate decarboxylase n=1 Tax=Marinobacterium ramblicola TaxID=2849041 RepID=UPI001C2D70A2|nr:diphosphomevalonate decarboxylase [Marinobacterium ramblicola]MBV1787220.1 diphosphomevalonate decarboxylase [Marinobacterium ramblicola]
MNRAEIMAGWLPEGETPKASGEHFAPSNIALCKYWGKRDSELNLPVNASLSVSLDQLGSRTRVEPIESATDEVWLNGMRQTPDSRFATRVSAFIDLFRSRHPELAFRVHTNNNIPTAAGLASSASGFAALTKALNDAFSLGLSATAQSVVARLGSGSACRSLFDGFVEWQMGVREDGLDSHAIALEQRWPGLSIGLLKVDESEKIVDSRAGMQRTKETAHLYQSWPLQAAADLSRLQQAIETRDFALLGSVAEQNALSMHATMIASWPPLLYWQPESVAAMQKVWRLRSEGLAVYFTMDAGPNLKLLFEAASGPALEAQFPGLEIVQPFGA